MGQILKRISSLPFQTGLPALLFRWILLAAILVPVIGAGFFNYYSSLDHLTQTAMARRQSIAFLAAATIKERFNRMNDVAQLALANRVQFYDFMKNKEWREAAKVLNTMPSDIPFVDRILLASPRGDINNETERVSQLEKNDPRFREWRETAAKEGKLYISNIYKTEELPARNVIALAIPLRPYAKDLEGIMLFEVTLDTLFQWAREIEVGEEGFLYFVDRKGQVAAHPDHPSSGEIVNYAMLPEVERVLRGESGVGTFYNPVNGQEQIVAYEPVSRFGWGVIVVQPAASAFELRDQLMKRLLWIYGIILLLSLLLVLFLLYSIRVRRETEEALKKAHDELEIKVNERTHELACSNEILRHEIKRRQLAEESLRHAVEKLKDSNAELEQFAFVASHDLQEPLRKIQAFGDLLEKAEQFDDESRDYVKRMCNAAERMSKLIQSLLELSRITSQGKPFETVDFREIAQEVLSDLEATLAHSGATVDIQGDWPSMKADPIQIRQLFSNLICNAIKFHKKDQATHITAKGEISEHDGVKSVTISFQDNGIGFDMRFKEDIFTPFRRLHRREDYEGSGMGLAICQKIALRHGARMRVESEPGKGSTFFIEFPKLEN